jgi:biotin carboxyl carrier protein
MTYDIEIDGEGAWFRLEPGEGAEWTFRFNDEAEQTAHCTHPEPGVWSILLEGRPYDARIEHSGDLAIVTVHGQRFEIRISDPRRWKRGSHSGAATGRQLVTAPMAGKVVRVLVKAGETVEAGQGLVVVEAMKMQNELKAQRAGSVVSVQVAEGDPVSASDTLVVIE